MKLSSVGLPAWVLVGAILGLGAGTPAAIWSFQQASAFVAAHRGFSAVAPRAPGSPFIFAYLMPKDSGQFLRYVDYWLDLKTTDGFRKRMHDYWILGKPRPQHTRRWSVIRNVLHWVK